MRGTPTPELSSGEYRITPTEMMREEYGVPLGDVLSGDFDFLSETEEDVGFHRYNVERADETAALEIVETHGSAEYDWLPFSVPQYVYLFVRPEGDPCLVVEVDHGWYPSYTILDPRTDETLGRVRKSRRLVGNWRLHSPPGDALLTAERTNRSGNLLSFSTHATYTVSAAGGDEIAQFERVRADGDLIDRFRSAMTVTCSPSAVSTELCLAFAFTLLYEGTKSSSGGTEGGD